MTKLDRQLREDRLLRDAAKGLVDADLARVKADLQAGNLGRRALARLKDGTDELIETAGEKAGNNPGIIAVIVGALALWFARNPILEFIAELTDENTDGAEPPIGDDT